MTIKDLQNAFLIKINGERSAKAIAEASRQLVDSFEVPTDWTEDDFELIPVAKRLTILERIANKRILPPSMKRDIIVAVGKKALLNSDVKRKRVRSQNMYPVCIRVDPVVWEAVKETAIQCDCSIASVVMDACKKYLGL